MTTEQVLAVQQCVRGSLTGEMTFPQIIQQLMELGVERYHADYSREENTFYLTTGESVVVACPHPPGETGMAFAKDDVASAVRQSQQGEHTYLDFVRKTMVAGCVGYFVQITGRKAIYFGRDGDSHVELFPSGA